MTTGAVPLCFSCDRYRPSDGGLTDDAPATCAAFVDGIPPAILVGGFDHRQGFAGDGGLRYVMRPGAGVELTAYEVDRARSD